MILALGSGFGFWLCDSDFVDWCFSFVVPQHQYRVRLRMGEECDFHLVLTIENVKRRLQWRPCASYTHCEKSNELTQMCHPCVNDRWGSDPSEDKLPLFINYDSHVAHEPLHVPKVMSLSQLFARVYAFF